MPLPLAFALALIAAPALGQNRQVADRPDAARPFTVTEVAEFSLPWAIAFLPDGRLLVTQKSGELFLVTQDGVATPVANVPDAHHHFQIGLLDVAPAPDFAESGLIYLTFTAPGRNGHPLTLVRARLTDGPALTEITQLWQQDPPSWGGHPGGIIAFDPAGEHLFLTSGDRTDMEPAQDPDDARGKILRFRLDGSVPPDNPMAGEGGIRALTWSTGHRNPYGLAFAPDGTLWEHEMGPHGGDELNRIEPGLNYGWPLVSNGTNYDGSAIPDHAARSEFAEPALWWSPVIAPAGMVFYEGAMFPQWQGSALIGGLAAQALVVVDFAEDGPDETARYYMEARVRDVAVAPDGAVWVIEDDEEGRLLRLTSN
jgi:Glucose/sorbosone dehydrogenases